MSHLPLDARAILHYLNELGYRNISAVQLKEFLKGMQPQSETDNKCKFKNQQQHQPQQQQLPTTPTTRNTTGRTAESASILQENPTSTATAATAHEISKRSPAVKVVKCKKPLCHFRFYLDIRDHQLTKRIEDQIKQLGGSLEFFLTPSVTHFITDKPIITPAVTGTSGKTNNNQNPVTPQTPKTPLTPQTPYSLECLADSTKTNNGLTNKKPIRNSRADAILNRARRQSTVNVSTPTTSQSQLLINRDSAVEQTSTFVLKHKDNTISNDIGGNSALPYVVWQCDIAVRFFKKVQHELKDYLGNSHKTKNKSYAIEPISLKGGFIKFECIKRNYRPYYHLFRKPQEWPKIELSREDGAFRLSPKKELPLQELKETYKLPVLLADNMTRKSRSKSSQNHHNLKNKERDLVKSAVNSQKQSAGKCKNQTPQHQKDSSDKQCGVCEICKIEYDALTIHLKTKDHEYFAKNSQNFIALDSLIHSSADVNKFLDENRKIEIKTELEEMEVEHEGLIIMEQDPLQNSENENDDDDDNDVEEDDEDDHSQMSSSTTKRKSVEPKVCSPTLREKSKRSTKGKHSSEKFQNCTITSTAKAPKTPSPQKITAALDIKTNPTRRKPSSTAAVSPPIRAMLPPSSMYKVVETVTDATCAPPRGKGVAAALKGESNVVGSPSIIVKFKKVRNTELEVLNGEAENFMFPKKRNDSSELPTDVDRQTTSDRIQRTQSSQQVLTSSSSSEEQDPEEEFEVKRKSVHVTHNGKRAIVKAKRRLSKICSSSTSKSASGGEYKQSFPKTPIQPIVQLKSEKKPTTAITVTTKRKSLPTSQSRPAKRQNATAPVTVSNKIVLPEATRKSSRTATAIVTAATTSTRLLQAAVEAAKSKHKLETSTKSKLPSSLPIAPQYLPHKQLKIKQELYSNSEQEDDNIDGNDILSKTKSRSKPLRCSRKSVVKMEDRMGDTIKKPQNSLNQRKLIQGFDVDDYEDDDITIDDEEEDDDKDEDFIVQSPKARSKLSSKSIKKPKANVLPAATSAVQTYSQAYKPLSKGRRAAQTRTLTNLSVREERLARRQSRLITQLQLELQTASEEEPCKEFPKPKSVGKKNDKKITKCSVGKSPSKTAAKLPKSETTKKSPVKPPSPRKKELSPPKTHSQPSRYFDYTKSERIKAIQYAFERLPAADLWYRVYKRQDNCEEKYFEYFGSTKYRKLPYELGPIPFDSTLTDHNRHKMFCKLCEDGRLQNECDKAKKLHVRRDLQLALKPEPLECLNKSSSLETQAYNCSSSSGHDKHRQQHVLSNIITDKDQDQKHSILNCSSHAAETKSYAHKHKKLHLLQRYRQELEQQEQLQRQKFLCSRLTVGTTEVKTEAVTQDCVLSRNDRAGSIHSNASSCASSTHTNCKSKKMRNKLLNKVSFLANLELPPRKSPREHASTLALVSCIIKQRQDSLSKPNSETDEPPVTPTETETESKVLTMAAEKLKSGCAVVEKEPPKTPPPLARVSSAESPAPNVTNSPLTRSQAATPIEELRFATEISETVKRMRRGRNKYDYSPPFVKRMGGRPTSARGRGRGALKGVVDLFGNSHKATSIASSSTQPRSNTPNINKQLYAAGNSVTRGRRRRGRQKGYNSIPKNPANILTSIRKTGSKKGVLEFDVDNAAIEALRKATTDFVNPKLLEWQIDKYLTLSNKQYEHDLPLDPVNGTTPENENEANNEVQASLKPENAVSSVDDTALNTPPATDYFSSDFDLCDIINQSSDRLHEDGDNASHLDRRYKKFSIFNTVHLNKYYRKRKNPKTNRTGWPKAPKKKAITRQQSMKDKIYFLQNGNIREEKCEKDCVLKNVINNDVASNHDDTTQEQTRESGVITPPDSENELDDNGKRHKMTNEDDEESLLIEEDSQLDLNDDSQTANDDDDDDDDVDDDGEEEEENNCEEEEEDGMEDDARIVEDDEETLADSVDEDEGEEEHKEQKADSDADADIEEADEDEQNTGREKVQHKCIDKKLNRKCKKTIPKIIENDDEDSYEPHEKRPCLLQVCPEEKVQTNLLNLNSTYTSTPTTTFLRGLRRTPQLNGSLGSCISPSEKAGDNSDIFTVSSDGLDTDMDLSNSQSQLRSANTGIEEYDHPHPHHHQQHQQHHHHHNSSLHHNTSARTVTPKRKFDISKYAPTNAVTCAAEAATAAVKSLAISQFLKKEVRVTCRRLRAPFRRFRYRR